MQVWVRGSGPVLGGGAGCQGCSNVRAAVTTVRCKATRLGCFQGP